ncbi:MAG: alpha/beta hydrolase [Planktomarina sp.]|nr:alpha/beta hydrolase [Planktomarina sp.]
MDKHRGTLDKKTLGNLRLVMSLFSDAVANPDIPIDGLADYLKFYQLPLATNNLQVIAGTTEDDATVVMAWRPAISRGVVIVVHGYTDHIGLYGHLIRDLLSRQLTVVCFDAQGHGLSSGAPCSISHFSEYADRLTNIVTLAQRHFEGPLHGIGQSMGGAVLIKHLINHNTARSYPFATLNLLAPLLQPLNWKRNRRLYYLSRWFLKSIKRVFRASSWDKEFLDFVRTQDPLQPTRLPIDWVGAMNQWILEFKNTGKNNYPLNIIQGDHDKTLDWIYNLEQFKQHLPSISVTMIERGNHHLVNESEPLRAKIFAALRL